ncbi:hypothetical protein PROFUN_06306 [Planoprotostelium fungivorum]|uniref:Uncharacterized protein n=1 Tax=Planoprotostelium fungivorum TaxID=1890364 RepID=A0A2P6NP27_9EUKA|nr:hypothetical protein PROFUN_06306 [Planoprotostelium fungivorum]
MWDHTLPSTRLLTVPRPTKDEVSNNSNTTHDCRSAKELKT